VAEPQLDPAVGLEHEPRQPAGKRRPEAGEGRVGGRSGGRSEVHEVDDLAAFGDPQDRRPPVVGCGRTGEPELTERVAAPELEGLQE